jgi:sulfur carrier protein
VGTTIIELIELADVPPNYLAVEVNGDVVPREQHAGHALREGDEVEVVTLVGGG